MVFRQEISSTVRRNERERGKANKANYVHECRRVQFLCISLMSLIEFITRNFGRTGRIRYDLISLKGCKGHRTDDSKEKHVKFTIIYFDRYNFQIVLANKRDLRGRITLKEQHTVTSVSVTLPSFNVALPLGEEEKRREDGTEFCYSLKVN